jgi:hypothetical protein
MATWLSGHTRAAFLLLAFVGCGEAFSGGGNEAGEAGAPGDGSGGSSGGSSGASAGVGGSAATSGTDGGASGSGAEGGEPGSEGGTGNAGNPGTGGSGQGGSANEAGTPGVGGTSGIAGTAGLAGTVGLAGTGGIVVEPDVPKDGLMLWLRADAGLNVTDDHHVASWADQSGNALLVEQTGADQRPALVTSGEGGLPRVEFDGDDDFMRIPDGFSDFSEGLSAFVVTSTPSVDTCWPVFELSNGKEIDDIFFGRYMNMVHYEVLDGYFSEGAYPVGEDLVLAVVHEKDQLVETRTNGNFAGDHMVPLPIEIDRTQNFLGRSQYDQCGVFEGTISEVLIYNRAVSSAELLAIEDYLATRWGCCRD